MKTITSLFFNEPLTCIFRNCFTCRARSAPKQPDTADYAHHARHSAADLIPDAAHDGEVGLRTAYCHGGAGLLRLCLELSFL